MISYAAKNEGLLSDHRVGLTFASEAALGLLNDLQLERCPDELAERTIRLLCAAAARNANGTAHRGYLFSSP
jgi:hypothetical protein